ncbi:ABC exporter membrane fusion protein [Oculatella sp. FACHB-28]|uniref:ABC exporter membrane fusion protein n=1 Tax=Cyanophyceae TaxID=3028117 RepID=UPI00168549C0|nr:MULTISPECIES: ABC exporter membrane fusion protein [Cyanophyceae]MBD1868067.1 ABC exporter membrane fusion protein [Cyanobacteria bacterium FACHB-471]MBD2001444.1 ABC exporter membrane fusion protein [Leptolyngbya sp. FACHB-541]MBD2054728.1 ABC exporter membrane fusion protein [Oculatella sp. FACHB-28]MBD2069694.1 ABC exporter membrane fusion protein [Leptolyngbya sp. FACHB-671]
MNLQLLSKPSNHWMLALIVVASTATAGIAYYGISQFVVEKPAENTQITPTIQSIVALGRLEPETEVTKVSVPATLSNDRVAQLLVKRGDRVQANQVIAILDSYDRLQGALLEAEQQVAVAQAELAQVRAGAKSGEIEAQQAEIGRLQAELAGETRRQQATLASLEAEVNNARSEYNRYQSLYQEGAISASQFDQRRLAFQKAQAQFNEGKANQSRTTDTLQAQIESARANLNRIAEVRPIDVQTAQAKVEQAIAVAQRAKADLRQAEVRSPQAGQILEIYAKAGEVVNEKGIADLGQTRQMRVVAEVYQSDIKEIRIGQQAVITGEPFSGELRGTVEEIGLQVSQQEIFNNQPGENLDQRVVKVRIRLNAAGSDQVSGLTNLQVQVAIQP